MVGNCKDCKSWDKNDGICNLPDWLDQRHSLIKEDAMAIWADATDDSGLDCVLRTGQMFGCIKFNEKK